MTEKRKNNLLGILVLGINSMTVAFASLSSTLNINGRAKVQNIDSSWNIHFAHIDNTANEIKTYEYATTTGTLDLSNSDTTVTVPHVTLKAPGDKVEYIFKVVNEGDITGYINVINNIGIGTITYGAGETLTSEQKTAFQNDIQVTLTYNDNQKTALSYNDYLEKDDEKELILTIQYVKRETTQVLPTTDVTFTNITASITYGQDETNLSGNVPSPSNPEVVQPSSFTMATMCPGCVFGKEEATIGESAPANTSSSYSGYSNGEAFVGYVVEGGNVTRAFACGIENGEAFCLEGYDTSKYSNNLDILKHFFPSCNVDEQDSADSTAVCDGGSVSGADADSDGYVDVYNASSSCGVDGEGYAGC